MSDDYYARELLRRSVAQVCRTGGGQSTPRNMLTQVLENHIQTQGSDAARYAKSYDRTESNLHDLGVVFQDRNVGLPELAENMRILHSAPSSLATVPFPCPKESNLNFLKLGGHEVITRPMHVHEHLPPMNPERKITPPVSDEVENRQNKHDVKPKISVTDIPKKDLFKRPLDPPAVSRNKRLCINLQKEFLAREMRSVNESESLSAREGKLPTSTIGPVMPSERHFEKNKMHLSTHAPGNEGALDKKSKKSKLVNSLIVNNSMRREKSNKNDGLKSRHDHVDKLTRKMTHRSRYVTHFVPPGPILHDIRPNYQELQDHSLVLGGGADFVEETNKIPIQHKPLGKSPRIKVASSTYIPRAIIPPENIHRTQSPVIPPYALNVESQKLHPGFPLLSSVPQSECMHGPDLMDNSQISEGNLYAGIAKNPVIWSLFPNLLANLFNPAKGSELITGNVSPIKKKENQEYKRAAPRRWLSIHKKPKKMDSSKIPKKDKNYNEMKNKKDKLYIKKTKTGKVTDDTVVGKDFIKKKKTEPEKEKKIPPNEVDGLVTKQISRLGSSSPSTYKSAPIQFSIPYHTDEYGNKVWVCPACGRPDNGSPMIGCDKCGCWYDWQCVGITMDLDDSEDWCCKMCITKRVKKEEKEDKPQISWLVNKLKGSSVRQERRKKFVKTGNRTGVHGDALPITTEECIGKHKHFQYVPDVVYCNVTFDKFLCWPPTPAGHTARQACPPVQALNAYGEAVRKCGQGGAWIGRDGNTSDVDAVGWTNYTDCIDARARHTLDQLENGNPEVKLEIAERTRYLELVGFSTSLIALIISLVIFYRFRSLRNTRTRIHKNLFLAMVLQVVVRLTLYIDHAIIRFLNGDYALYQNARRGIYNMPYLCESFYVLLEYGNTAMFMWMLVEGLYLHRVVTTSALREHACRPLYYFAGWAAPALGTAFWVLLNAFFYDTTAQCWWGYNFSPLYWILQGPRLAVILINMVFLLNILRVLIVKMKMTISSDLEKTKKAVRAAVVLLPLLGITNVLSMTEAPLDGPVWKFALWCYVIHFLTSFQGLFLAILYCFLNGEVRFVLKKCIDNRAAARQGHLFFFLYSNSDTHRGSRNRRYSSGNGILSSLQLRRQRSENKSGSAGACGGMEEEPPCAPGYLPPPSLPQPAPPSKQSLPSSLPLETRESSLNGPTVLATRSP